MRSEPVAVVVPCQSVFPLQLLRRLMLPVIGLLGALLHPAVAQASPGDLDSSFGVGGISREGFGVVPDTSAFGRSVIELSTGGYVVAGEAQTNGFFDVVLSRYTSAGVLDTSFGGGDGIALLPLGSTQDFAYSLIEDSSGRLVLAGYSFNGSDYDFAVARVSASGELDTSFGGGDGVVVTPVGSVSDQAFSVIEDSSGRLVLAGLSYNGTNNDFALVRYTSSGDLDSSFGGGDGIVTTAVSAGLDIARSVIEDSSGRLVVAGYGGAGNDDFELVRYTADGDLDTSFGGGDGIVTTAVGAGVDQAYSVLETSAGDLVVAGYSYVGSSHDFAVVRYTPDGDLDTGFGGGDGIVTTSLSGTSGDQAYAMTEDSSGRLLVVGQTYVNSFNGYDIGLLRYTPAGELDTSFGGGDGIVITTIGSGFDAGQAVIEDSSGNVLVAGFGSNGSNNDLVLVRYTSAGALDTSFGSGGKTATLTPGQSADTATSVLQDSSGRLVAGGYAGDTSNYDFALVRYTSAGALDTSFGGGTGRVTTALGTGSDFGQALIEDSSGRLLLGGYSISGNQFDFALARYTAAGDLDTSFGGDGKVVTAVGSSSDVGFALLEDSSSRLVLAGYSLISSNYDFSLVRYTTAGDLDTSFGGGDGIVITPVGASHDFAAAMIEDGSDRLVVVGRTYNVSNYDFALVRYTVDGDLDTSFGGGDGIVTTAIGAGDDLAQKVIEDSSGRLVVAGYTRNGSNYEVVLARYTSAGELDTSFGGGDGIVTTATGSGSDIAMSLIEDSSGRLVVAGRNDSPNNFLLLRYTDSGDLDTSFGGGDGITLLDTDTSDVAYSVIEDDQGRYVMAGGGGGDFMLARIASDTTEPVASAGGPYSLDEGDTLQLDASASSDSDGTIVAWDWDLDNDGVYGADDLDFSEPVTSSVDLGVQFDDVANYTIGLRVTDNDGLTSTTTTTVQVDNVAPLATDLSVAVTEDTPTAVTLGFTDPGTGDVHSYTLGTPPAKGALTGTAPNFTYTPAANATGGDSFTYTVSDDDGGTSAPATVTLTISSVNDLPTLSTPANATINRNTSTGAIAVTVADVETAAAALTLQASTDNATLFPLANIVTGGIDANRTVTLTPATDQVGSATVTLKVIDGDAGETTTTFTITVQIPDADGDGFNDDLDNCPLVANADQLDTPDGDGIGNVCDPDRDNDGIINDTEISNGTDPDNADSDSDGVNDNLDAFPNDSGETTDTDNDGVGNNADAFDSNPDASTDADGDGFPEDCTNSCGGLTPDPSPNDADNDGLPDSEDSVEGDNVAPVVTAPSAIAITASAELTGVVLGSASATDFVDGSITPVTPDTTGGATTVELPPGHHVITWSATDAAGNTGTATQNVDITPLVGFSTSTQMIGEGSLVTVTVQLNGNAVSYPVTIPLELDASSTAINPADHDGATNTITIDVDAEPANTGTYQFVIGDDGLTGEPDETVVFNIVADNGLDTLTGAVIDDSRAQQVITATELNVAPVINAVEVSKADRVIATLGAGDVQVPVLAEGMFTLTVDYSDANPEDSHSFAWTVNGALQPATGSELSFDVADYPEGLYEVSVQALDNGTPPEYSEALLVTVRVKYPEEEDEDLWPWAATAVRGGAASWSLLLLLGVLGGLRRRRLC